MDPINPINIDGLLDDAIRAAHAWESPLGKAKTGKAEKALSALKDGRLEAGNPQLDVRRLHRADFEKAGVVLSPEIRLDLKGPNEMAYYLVPVSVLLFPARGAQYRLLEADLSISPLVASQAVAIHSAFPDPLWKPVLNFGGALQLGLDGLLTWSMEVEPGAVQPDKLKGDLAARVKNTNQAKSFITLLPFEHSLGRMEIVTEFHPQRAMWRLDSRAVIREQKHTRLVLLLKAPPAVRQVKLRTVLQAMPNYDWLVMQIEHVFEHLSEAFRSAVKNEKGVVKPFDKEWILDLPQ